MKILVLSCDKNEDIFYAFHHCIEKYYKGHPEVIYATETIDNPYYKTIKYNYPLDNWTTRIRKTLEDIKDNHILIMIDDCFIRRKVDTDRINYIESNLKGNTACFNFEKSFDTTDKESCYKDFKLREKGSRYELSIMCGLWQKDILIKLLDGEHNPWEVEEMQNTLGYDFYINSGDYIIDYGYETWCPAGLCKGKWCKEIIPFFEKEGININYEKRGFYD